MPLSAVEALLGSAEHRDAAYLALAARRIGKFPVSLRNDLRDCFKHYTAQHWSKDMRPQFSGFGSILNEGHDPAESKRRDLTREALNTIALQRDEADLPLIRSVLATRFVAPTPSTITYLRALGNDQDISLLGKTSQHTLWWDPVADGRTVFEDAARAILRLHVGSAQDLMRLALPDSMRAELITHMPGADFSKMADTAILGLLLSENDELRRATAIKIPVSLSRARVRKLLAAYRSNENGRYYLVTHWLDLGLAFTRVHARRVATTKIRMVRPFSNMH